jgi:DNA polymerase III alpha subunit
LELGLENTQEIFEKCKDFNIPKKRYMPKFSKDSNEFKKITGDALKRFLTDNIGKVDSNEYIARWKKEYDIIVKYDLQDYFLIVWDIVNFARDNNILVGIGRGSAAGCLISYLMGIVRVDPIKHGLIFERFLNEERCMAGELPDIDLDASSQDRDRVKKYLIDKYGQDNVCEIGTFVRMRMKTSILDFGKAMGVGNHYELLKITKSLDTAETLEQAVEMSWPLKELFIKNEDFCFAVEEIEGQIKAQSIHPAGVIICSEQISEVVPLKTISGGKGNRVVVTQPEDKQLVADGMMKLDILGLKEYDIIKFIIERANTGFNTTNYVEEVLAYNGTAVWDKFAIGDSDCVFQFSSDNMKSLLRLIKPRSIGELAIINALYRPGPIENGWHIEYAQRKNGEKSVEKEHPIIDDILKDTYGLCIFQEQVMRIFNELADIPLSDSDTIRSALGKKDEVKLKKFRERFIDGAMKKVGEERAIYWWDSLVKFSGYSFNKCLSGAEKFFRDSNRASCTNYTIKEMYELKNGSTLPRTDRRSSIQRKYRRFGYGKAYSLGDGRLRPNKIVDIRYAGERRVYRVTLSSGKSIVCTDNHKFPTNNGEKQLKDCKIGDSFYVNDGYEKSDMYFLFGVKNNLPKKGQQGFQKLEYAVSTDCEEKRAALASSNEFCQHCDKKLKRKEMHHKDGNHGNQDLDNLEIVCPSCHKKKHYQMGRTKRGGKGLLTRLEEIVSIVVQGKEDVYDVEMEGPNHNFLTSEGIVTCNSHSVSYAILAYISQYLKVKHTPEFYAAHLNMEASKGKKEELISVMKSAKLDGIEFTYPGINTSEADFYVKDKRVVFSVLSIKGIGGVCANEILSKKPYINFKDFYTRVHKAKVKMNNMASLIHGGALDAFGERKDLLAELYLLKEKPMPKKINYYLESFTALGFLNYSLNDKFKLDGFGGMIGKKVECCGLITAIRVIKTKNDEDMAFVSLTDNMESVDLTIFPLEYECYKRFLHVGEPVGVSGKKDSYNGKELIQVRSMVQLEF